jgi:hypothetical protein
MQSIACDLALRALPALAVTGATLAIGAQPAVADVALRASVSPASVRFPAQIDYTLTMVNNGDMQERFSVALVSPTYHASAPRDAIAESSSIREIGSPMLDGPGSILGGYTHVAGLLANCSLAGAGGHGYGLDGVSFDVGLPARSTSTLRATYEAGLPFWPDLDLRLRFVLRPRLTTGWRGTLTRSREVVAPQPAITGPVAAHITFRTQPASGLLSDGAHPPVARGQSILITGRMDPAVRGARVELRYARIGSRSTVIERGRAARLRTDARGRFRGRWTPPHAGSYELWARYESRRPDVLTDDTCPRLLRVSDR